MAYQTPQQENRELWGMFVLSWILAFVLFVITTSCKPKTTQTVTRPPSVPAVDSFRINLEHQRDSAQNKAIISSQHSQTAVNQYEKDKESFDGIHVVLP